MWAYVCPVNVIWVLFAYCFMNIPIWTYYSANILFFRLLYSRHIQTQCHSLAQIRLFYNSERDHCRLTQCNGLFWIRLSIEPGRRALWERGHTTEYIYQPENMKESTQGFPSDSTGGPPTCNGPLMAQGLVFHVSQGAPHSNNYTGQNDMKQSFITQQSLHHFHQIFPSKKTEKGWGTQ